MKTEVLKADENTENAVALAAELLKHGELVAVPTETVYGLAGNALLPDAARKIYEVKGRPSDNPLIVHISDISQIYPLVESVPPKAMKLAERFWPGPLTMIFKKSDMIPDSVSGGLDTVAIRLPDCPVTREIISRSAPLAAPSANLSGSPSPTSAKHVYDDLNGRIPLIIDGGECRVGVESTVITFAEEEPTLLRPGGVTREQIEAEIGAIRLHSAVVGKLESNQKATSPGMKYKHYAPDKKVILLDCDDKDFIKYLRLHRFENIGAIVFDEEAEKVDIPFLSVGSRYDERAHAHNLFDVLRRCDDLPCDTVYAHLPKKTGLSLAVYNRLIRAAAHNIIKPNLPVIIGITGPSGAGKSTVCAKLSQRGCSVIDADSISREIMQKGSSVLNALSHEFGKNILSPNGSLDRAALARIAFSSREATNKLNSITHPAIIRSIIEKINLSDNETVILDAPLLFESGLNSVCDAVVGVLAPYDERIKRVTDRDDLSSEDARLRFSAGKNNDYYVDRCDIIINNTDLSGSVEKINEFINKYIRTEA